MFVTWVLLAVFSLLSLFEDEYCSAQFALCIRRCFVVLVPCVLMLCPWLELASFAIILYCCVASGAAFTQQH
jgi:hypothetical protein